MVTAVLLHGLAGASSEWQAVTDLLGGAGTGGAGTGGAVTVIAPDARGHGLRPETGGDVSREAHVADAVAILREAGPSILVGQSLGGLTALRVAAEHPELVTGLLLIEAGPERVDPATPGTIAGWLDSWPVPFPSAEAAAAFFGGGPAGEGWAATLAATPDGLRPRFDRDTIVATIKAATLQPSWPAWKAITCPAAVLLGAQGFLGEEEQAEMRRLRPDIPLTTVPGVGHDVHLEAPEQVAAQILALAQGNSAAMAREL
ncbi:alpha/beta hydrolase [Nonomuraea sp. NBC_01738]|uniref:alpha/beta fold hydrolase n=1 Tax=Nonomuraea sp. NBC_01738 TaxID=2976003 RepID=UPI002E0DDE1E|nr:alpha/beta hydrolase [Nonomuraea sp. NBC_01738]